ncbi:MAG: hypothetical protein CMH52_07180 [Myxococcales bacterium]|nr:hypothetical protein [Myxococcales bacterium]
MSKERAELETELKAQIGTADWPLLAMHARAGNLIRLSAKLDLLDVAVAVALNDTKTISGLLTRGLLNKPDPTLQDELASLKGRFYQFVIVAPFILVQDIDVSAPQETH